MCHQNLLRCALFRRSWQYDTIWYTVYKCEYWYSIYTCTQKLSLVCCVKTTRKFWKRTAKFDNRSNEENSCNYTWSRFSFWIWRVMSTVRVFNRSDGSRLTEAEVSKYIRSWEPSQIVLSQPSRPAVHRGSLSKICRGHWYVICGNVFCCRVLISL